MCIFTTCGMFDNTFINSNYVLGAKARIGTFSVKLQHNVILSYTFR